MFIKIKTLAGQIRSVEKARRLIAFHLALAILTGTIIVTLHKSVKTIKIKDGDVVTQVRTVQSDPYEILNLAGVKLDEKDQVLVSNEEMNVIEINRAFPVIVKVDGKTEILKMLAKQTVADALQLCGITVDEDVEVTPSPSTVMKKNMCITVVKAELVEEKITQKAPQEQGTETKEENKKTEQKPEVAEKPVDEQAVVSGTKVISTLTPEKPIELDANGRPVNYVKKLTGKATAYCQGTTCSTGVKVRPGYIAVNPKQIPYGTKMYIVSADGKYHYGYSIAADTGGFAKKGTAIADLYMYNYDDCIQFGRRYIEIYILE